MRREEKLITLLILALPIIVFSQTVSVRLGEPSQTPAPGVTFSVPVYINTGAQPLGAYTFSIAFDPVLLYVVSIESGTALQFDCSPQGCCVSNSNAFTQGFCLLTAHQGESLTQPTGESLVCRINLRVPQNIPENVVISYTLTPLIICNTSGTIFEANAVSYDYFYGNEDGLIQMLVDTILGTRVLNDSEKRVGDKDADGEITVLDIIRIINE